MKKHVSVMIFLLFQIANTPCSANDDPLNPLSVEVIKEDYKNFYLDSDILIKLGIGIGIAGIMANTSMDKDIQDYYRDNLKSSTTDNFSKIIRQPGEVYLTIPALVGIYAFFRETPTGEWAQKSLRAIAVGVPSGFFLQRLTGASRPSGGDSKWTPFKDNDGLSGHAFIGAVPFLTAARMNDNQYMKGILYGLSILPGLSRINDNKHYFSQAALGWYLAYLSCTAVDKTEKKKEKINFAILPSFHGGLIVLLSSEF